MTQPVLKQSKLPQHVRTRILTEQAQKDNTKSEAKSEAKSGAKSGPAQNQGAEPGNTQPATAKAGVEKQATQAKLALKDLAAVLSRLDDQRAMFVLKQLPAHQLARALEQILSADGNCRSEATQTAPQSDMGDKRSATRTKTMRIGKIIYNNLMSVTNCSIADLSDTGCRITIVTTVGIPNCFTLHIINGNLKRECEVVWRKHGEMGVRFF